MIVCKIPKQATDEGITHSAVGGPGNLRFGSHLGAEQHARKSSSLARLKRPLKMSSHIIDRFWVALETSWKGAVGESNGQLSSGEHFRDSGPAVLHYETGDGH